MYNFRWILTWVYYYFGGIFGLILFWCREILSVNYYPDFGVAGFWDTTIKLNLVLFCVGRFWGRIVLFDEVLIFVGILGFLVLRILKPKIRNLKTKFKYIS